MELPRRIGAPNLRTSRDGVRVPSTLFHARAGANLELGTKRKAGQDGGVVLEDQAQGAVS